MNKSMPDTEYKAMINVVKEVSDERKNQFVKWGSQATRPQIHFLAIAGEEYGEVAKEIVENFMDTLPTVEQANRLRKEWIQLAAVCVQAVEAMDSNQQILPTQQHTRLPYGDDLPL